MREFSPPVGIIRGLGPFRVHRFNAFKPLEAGSLAQKIPYPVRCVLSDSVVTLVA